MLQLVIVQGLLIKFYVANLYQSVVNVAVIAKTHAHRQIDVAPAHIVRPDVQIIVLEAWLLGDIDWILVAFLLFIGFD